MNQDNLPVEGNDLAFFGQVNAGISHELKNIFAIISETGGLLTDLTEMTAQGNPLEPETLRSCIRDIVEEIQRGFEVVKVMNRFSHSVDAPYAPVDVAEVVKLMARIVKMLSFVGTLEVIANAGAANVETFPFRLQQLIYRLLVAIFRKEGLDGQVKVTVQPDGEGQAEIRLTGFRKLNPQDWSRSPIPELAAALKVDLHVADGGGLLRLQVPSLDRR